MARRPASILYEISKRLPFLNVKYFGLREDGHPRYPLMLGYQHRFRILRFIYMNANHQFQRRLTSPRVSRTTFRSTATNAWSRAASSEDTASRTASNCSRSSCSSRSCAEIPRYLTLIASISPPSEPATQGCTEEEVSNGIS